MTYEQIIEGEWYRPTMKGHRNQCCGCGLVHVVDYRKLKVGLEVRVKVDQRATAAARRGFKFEKEGHDD